MTVLAVHDGHDASACLMRDGKVVLGSAEERRRNSKNFAGVPTESIQAIFDRSGIKPSEVDLVAICGRIRTTVPHRDQKRDQKALYRSLVAAGSLGRWQWSTTLGQWLLEKTAKRQELYQFLDQLGVKAPRVAFDHHETHAACAYFHRKWDEDAVVLTLDGAGDGLCATVWKGHGNEMQRLARTPKFHSLPGQLYSNITAHLGMRPYEHEYKVMGMAPYGQSKYCIDKLSGMFSVDGLEFRNHTGKYHESMINYLHKRLKGQRFDNVSAACQEIFETLVVQWAKNAVAATGIGNIAAAGGAFLNVKANKLIRELPEVKKLYVYPASDDGGTSVGAAILGHLYLCRQKNSDVKLDLPKNMYLGLEFSDEECLSAIQAASNIDFKKMADVSDEIGALLANKQIVARFAEREEWGPRALGNRSILADPRDMGIIRKLNFAIKHRDFWMPFAASMLEEDAQRYIKDPSGWPFYMIEAFDTKQPEGEEIVAGTHPFDNTVRPQIVNELNPQYRDIIRAFKKRTGIGALLNTSFNLHGFPIVGTPAVAIDTLLNSELDALALGSYLVWRKGYHPRF